MKLFHKSQGSVLKIEFDVPKLRLFIKKKNSLKFAEKNNFIDYYTCRRSLPR